jgi:hypothetical protein
VLVLAVKVVMVPVVALAVTRPVAVASVLAVVLAKAVVMVTPERH